MEILGRELSNEELIKISEDGNLFALYSYYEEELNKNQKTSFWRRLFGH